MEVLQIFNRRTGVWSHRIILTAGYTESFVLDKSTDSAEVKWWEFTDSEIEPPYQDDDWVLVMHVDEKNDPVIFNADGTTKNATQYIIKSISKDYDEGNGLWKMSCALEEPIERFKRIVGETLSFTNQTKKTYSGEFTSTTNPAVGMSAANKTVRLTYRGGIYSELFACEDGELTKFVQVYWLADSSHAQYYIRYGSGANDTVDGDITGEYIDIDLTPYNFGEITRVENDKASIQFVEYYSNPTFYKEPYNYYTALRRWLLVTPANCDTYAEEYTYSYLEVEAKATKLLFANDGSTGNIYNIGFADNTWISVFSTYDDTLGDVNEYYKMPGRTLIKRLAVGETYIYTSTAGKIISIGYYYTGAFKESCKTMDLVEYPRSSANKSWYNRIKVPDEQWLRSIPFADDTWNEMDLYRILFDKYDPLGKTPVIYFDLNTNTTLPYNMARDEYILKFERQDGFDKPIIDFEELISRKPYERLLSYEVSKDNSTNITGLVCNAENLSSPTVVHYPAQGLFMPPEVNADIRDTTGAPYNAAGNNGWVLRLPFPIKRINKLTKLNVQGRVYTGGEGDAHYVGMMIEDRTSFVLEKQQYLANNVDLTSNNEYYWYEEGENLLYLKEYYWGEGTNAFVYNVEYEPLPSARLLIGNEEKTQQINQTSSQVDAESFGRFADGYLKGSNKADITIGKLYAGDYEDFADLIGSRVKRGDKTYMITQVAYRNIGMDGYNVFMQLNENHMRKNASYSAPQEIRANTAIATSNLKNRLTAIKQVVKIGFTAAAVANNDSYQFLTDKKILLSALCPTQIDSKYYPQVALFKGKSTLYTDVNHANATEFNITRLATVAKTISQNQINLITTFYDNAEAGKSKIINLVEKTWASGFVYGDVQEQIPVLYTDPFGGVQKISLLLGSIADSGTFYNRTYGPATEELFESIFNAYSGLGYLPQANPYAISQIQNSKSIEVDSFAVHKDSLEKLNINTAVEVVGAECIVCQDLINLSRLLNQTDTHTLKVWTKDSNINEYDTFTDGAAVNVSSTTTEAGYIQLNLASVVTGATGKALVISTGTNNPLVVYNGIDANTAALLADKKLKIYFE